MGHDGVAGGHDIADIARADGDFAAEVLDDRVHGGDDLGLQCLEAAISQGIDDAGDDVSAVDNLGIVGRGLGHYLAGVQVDEGAADGSRADVAGKAVESVGCVAGLDCYDGVRFVLAFAVQEDHGYLPIGLAEQEGQFPEEFGMIVLRFGAIWQGTFDAAQQSLHIRDVVVEVRGRQVEEDFSHGGAVSQVPTSVARDLAEIGLVVFGRHLRALAVSPDVLWECVRPGLDTTLAVQARWIPLRQVLFREVGR